MPEKFSPDINKLNHINQQFYFLGTMHLAESSANMVKQAIETLELDCVMIELDQIRYQNLLEQKTTKHEDAEPTPQKQNAPASKQNNHDDGSNNFMESLKEIQEGLGKILGITPGLEMILAINTVKTMKLPILFIDRPIVETFQRLQEIQDEVQTEQKDLLDSMEENPLDSNSSELQELMQQMQNPGFLTELILDFKKNYPNLAKILLTERNEFMVNKIMQYAQIHPSHRILIITGAGHTQEIFEMIEARIPRN